MSSTKTLATWAAALALAASTPAFAQLTPDQVPGGLGTEQVQPETAQPQEQVGDAVAATVEGEEIYQSEIDEVLAPYQQQFAQMPPEQRAMILQQAQSEILNQLISQRLVLQYAKEHELTVGEEEVEERIAEISENMAGGPGELDQILATMGMDREGLKKQLSTELLFNKAIENYMATLDDPDTEEVAAFYEENKEMFSGQPEQVTASHILLGVDPGASEDARAEKLEQAQGLLEQVHNGAEFADLAREYSTCPSSARGGDLGSFTRNRMVAPFEEAAFAMEPGEVSDIVETDFGYHIIKVTDRQAAEETPFEEVQEDIVEMLKGQKVGEWLEGLQANADVQIHTRTAPPQPQQIQPPPRPDAAPPAPGDVAPPPPAPGDVY